MASRDDVIFEMQASGLPPLPAGHPICDGKERRFGPKKKAWYKLTEIDTNDGRKVVYGVFGYWRGTDNGAIGVTLDADEVSKEDLAAARQRQEDAAKREEEKRLQAARAAAGRAHNQWNAASTDLPSPYLDRKQVPLENARVAADGTLLIPMRKYAVEGTTLAGLQKIAPDGTKIFNKGMDKVGTACLLGPLNNDTPILLMGEGYATAGSLRLALEYAHPAMVAFDAGNLLAVAQRVRQDFPAVHILFAADDDWQLKKRLAKRLVKDFKVAATIVIDGVPQNLTEQDFADDGECDAQLQKRLAAALSTQLPLSIDGSEQILTAEDGEKVRIIPAWKLDANGVDYLEADVRSGRQARTLKLENAGIAKAKAAVAAIGNASVIWPAFADRGEKKWTDFNDLHVEQSIEAVKEQVSRAIDAVLAPPARQPIEEPVPASSPAPSDDEAPVPESPEEVAPVPEPNNPPSAVAEWANSQVAAISKATVDTLLEYFALVYGTTDVWDGLNRQRIKRAAFIAAVGKELAAQWLVHEKRRTITADALPVLRRGRAIDGGGGGDRLSEMLERLTLLYGTVTVWDSEKRVVMSLDAVRAAYSGEMVKRWQEHALRRMIDADRLVFDPRQQVSPDTHINMFHGLPLVPKQDDEKCLAVLDLLYDLCGGEDNAKEVGDWLIKWLAYPLQHPGAKMQTAVLMFGEKQGTGKSLFFEGIMRPIYGEYGGTAGQHQLDSSFTDWKSRKIYMVFEEVLSRDDRYSHIGTLKHMITGRDMRINPKNLPERVESNHLNSVFLSNESQPIPIELEDRRFMVIEARNKLSEQRVAVFKQLMEEGLSAAFYHFLLNYPLGDFDEHSKPLMTEAKRKIIRFGRPGWDAFHEAWKEGELPAPYTSCLSEDLYRVYSQWCERNHERRLSLTKFAELLSSREMKEKKWVALGNKPKKTKMVFVIDDPDEPDLNKQCQKFRDLADIKAEV